MVTALTAHAAWDHASLLDDLDDADVLPLIQLAQIALHILTTPWGTDKRRHERVLNNSLRPILLPHHQPP